jgi:hypothetical protein
MKEVCDWPVIVGEAQAIHQQGGLLYVPHRIDPFRHGIATLRQRFSHRAES